MLVHGPHGPHMGLPRHGTRRGPLWPDRWLLWPDRWLLWPHRWVLLGLWALLVLLLLWDAPGLGVCKRAVRLCAAARLRLEEAELRGAVLCVLKVAQGALFVLAEASAPAVAHDSCVACSLAVAEGAFIVLCVCASCV
jgi:hypothetical protein